MEYPKISVIMPTLNSEKTIEKSLKSVRDQEYPQDKVEILVIDGGSTDKTVEIAKKYGARILSNPKVQQEYAKHIGILNATGDYLMFLDSDEVLVGNDNLRERMKFIVSEKLNILILVVQLSPENSNQVNCYITKFGDPFFHFTNYFFVAEEKFIMRIFKPSKVIGDFFIPSEERRSLLGIFDIAGSNILEREFLVKSVENINSHDFVPSVISILIQKGAKVGIIKSKFSIEHHSGDYLSKYVNKLRWRVVANIHYSHIPGVGFSNREKFLPSSYTIRKYLFMPYSLTLVIPLVESIYYWIKFKKPIFLLHWFFTFYVGINIVWNYFLKLIGVKPTLKSYGNEIKRII